MKVFVAWFVPDYIGIDIIGIFLKEEDANNAVKKFLEEENYLSPDNCGVAEFEVK